LLWHEGTRDAAVAHYEQAIALDANFAEAYIYLCKAMHFLGRIDEAMRCAKAVIRLDPSSAGGYMNLGRALRVSGRFEDAISQFRQAIALDGGLAEAYENYAYAGRVAEGGAFSDKLKSAFACRDWSKGERAYLHYAAGKVESDQGRHEAAFKHWAQGVRQRRKTINYATADS